MVGYSAFSKRIKTVTHHAKKKHCTMFPLYFIKYFKTENVELLYTLDTYDKNSLKVGSFEKFGEVKCFKWTD